MPRLRDLDYVNIQNSPQKPAQEQVFAAFCGILILDLAHITEEISQTWLPDTEKSVLMTSLLFRLQTMKLDAQAEPCEQD